MNKNVLIIGSGGREHALGWRLAQSPLVGEIYFAPGNGGTPQIGKNIKLDLKNFQQIYSFCLDVKIDLIVVGPEDPLVDGIVDFFREKDIPIFGPDKYCAQIEGSKRFAKELMIQNNIPTAMYNIFKKEEKNALISYLRSITYPHVFKADGLAAGKGVIIVEDEKAALDAVSIYFESNQFGAASDQVVLEEFMVGEEASLFVLTDGFNYRIFPAAQDHKRIFDNDLGKNTGGMGAYAPTPVLNENMLKEVEVTIVQPTLKAFQQAGHPYTGILYIGLMITSEGAKVVEYNCRFGDPECQVEMMLMDGDLYCLLEEVATGHLTSSLKIKPGFCTTVVGASKGYPDEYEKGKLISFRPVNPDRQMIFQAGTTLVDHHTISSGGRVINATGYGDSLLSSIHEAYQALACVSFEGMVYRKDIGKKGLAKT